MRTLADISCHYTPLLEAPSPGRFFLDLTGSRRLLGPGRDAALRLDREIFQRLRLSGAVGVAGNKMVSKIASGYLEKPGICDVLRGSEEPGICDVLRGSEASFIAPLPVDVLPGVGGVRERILLTDLNLRRVAEVAALTVPQLTLVFGPFSHLLHQRARGFDPSPVLPPRRTPDIVEQSFLTREDNCDVILIAELCRLAEGCGVKLRRSIRAAGKLSLTIHYADGMTRRRSGMLNPPVSDDLDLLVHARDLFEQAYGRRIRVKGMSLSCSNLTETDRQMNLFRQRTTAARHSEALQSALDRIREKYDRDAVRWGLAVPGTSQSGKGKG
jgi:DNA polymerase-4